MSPIADTVPRSIGTRYPAQVEKHYAGWAKKLDYALDMMPDASGRAAAAHGSIEP